MFSLLLLSLRSSLENTLSHLRRSSLDTIKERHRVGKGVPHRPEQFPKMWCGADSEERAIIEFTDAVLNYPSTRPLPPTRLQLYNMSLQKTTG
ncbi:hypothetical protein EV421DRAFT_1816727 [Armillaria borealis]|uniref:Uncharacterized protein n=1 Tax=Armillaria borealis TaxID=47425 RepID=A0AA39JCZ6_9AGAR|nr:hypothetical protein EV421DRAFT_1816727 [Armillaria borealis]